MNTQENSTIAIYIVGADVKIDYEKEFNFLSSKFDKVIVIGDGDNGIIDIDESLQKCSKDNKLELQAAEKVFVYLDAHGAEYNNTHYIYLAKTQEIYKTKELFKLLAENIKKTIDIVFIPCHGKAAMKDIEVLPEGSRIIMFSDHNKLTVSTGISMTLDKMSSINNFTLDDFYNHYLANVVLMDESPTLSVVNGDTIDPVLLSQKYLGKIISETSRQYVQNNFAHSICKDESDCYLKIDQLMNRIEQASCLDVFKTSNKQLLFTLSQYISSYEVSRNNNHEKDVIYNHKESESCYIELLDFKSKIDKFFLENGVPLELDLTADDLYEIDYDITDADELSLLSNNGIYNMLKQSGNFIENNNFLSPEPTEYGYVLGIIKDIHLSLDSDVISF